MSQPGGTDLGQRLYAFLRGESEPAEALFTEDFKGHLTEGLPLDLGGDYDVRDDMISRGWGRVGESFAIRPELEAIYAVDDLVVGRGHWVGQSIDKGRSMRAAFAHFWGVRHGRVHSVHQVTDSAAWEHALD